MSLPKLVNTINDSDIGRNGKVFGDCWEFVKNETVIHSESYKTIEGFDKS